MDQGNRGKWRLPSFGRALLVLLVVWLLLLLLLAILVNCGVLLWRYVRLVLCLVWTAAGFAGACCLERGESKWFWLQAALLPVSALMLAWLAGQLCLGGASLGNGGAHFLLFALTGSLAAVTLRRKGGKKQRKFARRKR